MKVAISCEGRDPTSAVSRRFGTARYFLIVDLKTEALTAVENPGAAAQRGAGVQAVALLLGRDVGVLLTGYCSPAMQRQLENNGVKVFSGLTGAAQDVLQRYKTGRKRSSDAEPTGKGWLRTAVCGENLRVAARRSWNQVLTMLPMTIAVVLLVGLFNGFISKTFLQAVFSGHVGLDTIWGACAGSLLAGNPINSYIIGGELLKQGISLFAVTAFMLTWVTVGLVQLPAEMAALGRRFALRRNIACFLLALPMAIATVVILAVLNGGPA
jgi:predicted Fe-Mo cluster-binding NifX family protein